MGKISELSDELLVKILSFLPTKVAVSTSILSKQWEFLWMWLPKLEYSSSVESPSECKRSRCFLDRNLPLHRAPVIESFCIKSQNSYFMPEDIKLWVLIAVSRYVHELKIHYYSSYPNKPNILPSSLYTSKSLVTLKLNGKILLDVPRMVYLPSLKALLLKEVTYFNEDSLKRLLSNCPILEDLLVDGCFGDSMGKFSVIISSLMRLTLSLPSDLDEFVIATPSLNYFKLQHYSFDCHYSLIENMPKLREAYVDVRYPHFKSLIGSITSVKHLSLCLKLNTSVVMYGDGFVFNQLKHLKLCAHQDYLSNIFERLLKDSPNLRELELFQMNYHQDAGLRFWNQPNIVPKCMLSSLQTFNWSGYIGTPQERDLAIYILKNARRLKAVTIESKQGLVPTLDMLKELALSSRASTTCQLVFY